MLSTVESPKTTRKSGRSTSPRAVERRRLQNRLSQRKHRMQPHWHPRLHEAQLIEEIETGQRVKTGSQTTEAAGGSQTDSDTQELQRGHDHPEDTMDIPSRLVSADSRSTMQYPVTENDHAHDPLWLPVDPIITMPTLVGNEGRVSHPGSTSSICACCSRVAAPGHLAFHHDYSSAESALPRRQSQYKLSTSSPPPAPCCLASSRANCNLSHSITSAKNPFEPTGAIEATLFKPLLQAQSQMHPTPHLSPTSELLSIPYTAAQPGGLRGEDELATAESASESTNITRRLANVLEAIRAAGFEDFDETAAAYYTARLDKGSFPAMVQGASRGRRLKTMLQTVQRSSEQWSRWESRGLQETICECSVTVALPRRTTATLCVAEINRFSNHTVHAPGENELASLITALETLLSSHKVGMSGETGIQSATPPEEMGLLEQMENAPDAMPFLWSLLTEFAGTRSVYCDRVARLVLTILLYGRSA